MGRTVFKDEQVGIETGSDSNGSYIKFPDGSLVCFLDEKGPYTTTSAQGSSYSSDQISFTYPHAFISTPRHVTQHVRWSSGRPWAGLNDTGTTTGTTVRIMGTTATNAGYVALTAWGRWK